MRYDYEFKKKCVDLYRQGIYADTPEGVSDACFKSQIRKWSRRMDAHGPSALIHKKTKRKWSPEEKLQLVFEILAGTPLEVVAINAGIVRSVLQQWVRKYRLEGYNGLVDKKKGQTLLRSLSERIDYAENPDKTQQDIDAVLRLNPVSLDQMLAMLADRGYEIRQGKGASYIRWAKTFNLKQMAQVLLYLQEHGINDYDELVQRTDSASTRYDQLATSIKSAETRLAEIATLKRHIFNYSRTKDVYAAYRQSGFSKRFYEQHREELTLHKAAKDAFNQLSGNVPRIKDLNAEYAAILDQKRRDYADYRTARADMRQLVMARKNIEILLELDENEHERDQNQRQSSQHKR